jgi:hypothetical protein
MAIGDEEECKRVSNLVKKIIDLVKSGEDSLQHQNELDSAVYKLYGLDETQVSKVEKIIKTL